MENEIEIKINEKENKKPIILKSNYLGSLKRLEVKLEKNSCYLNVEAFSTEDENVSVI